MSERVLLEVHAHTSESSPCAELTAAELVAALHAAGYGAAVITDHYLPGCCASRPAREAFLAGYRAARRAGEALGMIILPGLEIRFKGHSEEYLVYGLEEEDILSLPDDACENGLYDFHCLAREKGWMLYQAHPFRPGQLPANPAFIDGMETFNGNPRHNSQNRLPAAFATRHNLRALAGTDVHRRGDAGVAGLLAPRDALTPRGLAQWLRATPHPRVQWQEAPVDGIRYLHGAIPGKAMLEALYRDAGWMAYASDIPGALRGLRGSLRVVTAWDDTALVGMARAIGDGETIVFVQDILVLGAYRRRGIGRALMRRLLDPFPAVRQIVLICEDTADTRGFYRACGFESLASLGCAGYVQFR